MCAQTSNLPRSLALVANRRAQDGRCHQPNHIKPVHVSGIPAPVRKINNKKPRPTRWAGEAGLLPELPPALGHWSGRWRWNTEDHWVDDDCIHRLHLEEGVCIEAQR